MKEIKRGFTLIELPVVRKRAFTLIELLVVIAIIGILATVVILNVANARVKAQDAQVKADFNSILKAADMYFVLGGNLAGLDQNTTQAAEGSVCYREMVDTQIAKFIDDSNNSFLSKVPEYPGYNCIKKYYIYAYISDPPSVLIQAWLPSSSDTSQSTWKYNSCSIMTINQNHALFKIGSMLNE